MKEIESRKKGWREKRFGLKKLQHITRVFIAFIMIFMPLISAIPVKTFAVTEGTADGTYDFGGLGDDDSAGTGTGFAKLGDKFHISNGFDKDDTSRIYANGENLFVQDGTTSFVIKAEGGDVCKTFTFEDLGISGFYGNEILDNFKLEVKDKDGNVTTVVNVVDANKTLTPSTQQISALFGQTINYPNVVEIKITYKTELGNDLSYVNFDNITIADVSTGNEAPTDIALSNSSIPEDAPSGTPIGTLSAIDPNVGDTHTYVLVSGDTGNFSIVDNELRTNGVFDFETKNSYTIKIRVIDSGGATYEQTFSISVTDANDAPTALALSSNTVSENSSSGTTIGTLSATDPDEGDTQTYSLVPGDMGNFSIDGNQLKTKGVFDYETMSSYPITVKATDTGGLTKDQTFIISVTNVNEAPTNISLANSSVAENQASGTAVGPLTTTDPEGGDTHTYSLVSGEIGNFAISGNVLITNGVFDFETKNSYTVKVRSTDSGGLYFEKDFTVSVTDANESPILNNTNVTLIDTDEDTASSQVTVSSFLDSTDPDIEAIKGIAVTGTSGNGTWQYLDSIWKPFPSLSNNNALLLRDTDIFRYIPDGNNGETAKLTFRVWDRSTGSPFSLVDASNNGGDTAFSAELGTASLNVSSVNDAPTLTSTQYTFSAVEKNNTSTAVKVEDMATMSDVDNDALSGIAITHTTGSGTWEYSLDGTSWEPFGTISETSSLLLKSTDQVRYKSSNIGETASFTFRGWDQSQGSPGAKADTTANAGTTAFSANTQTASIEVQKSSEAEFLSFTVPNQLKPAVIGAGAIYVEVAGTENVGSLVPTFTTSDFVQSVKVGSNAQTSGTIANDFSNPVTYTITAENGTTKNWVVTVNRVPTALTLSKNSVDEKAPIGTEVGTLSGVDPDSNAILSYLIQAGDTNAFEIDNDRLITKTVLDYNEKKQYDLTIRVTDQHGAFFDETFTINVLDKTPPTVNVTITSNNTNTTKAKVGDIITLNIEASEDIQTPTVTIAGKSATVTDNDDSNAKTWEATYQMEASDAEGLVAFTIDYKDLVNNSGTQVTSVTTGTDVTFDKTAPTASTVTITSSNIEPTKAKIGDTITLAFTTSEDVQQPIVTIAGKAATVSDLSDSNAKTWQATYVTAYGDTEGPIVFAVNFSDIAGNAVPEVTATTNASAVTFDGIVPTAPTVTMTSNNTDPKLAKVGDTITLEIETSEDVQQPSVTIAGKVATVTDKSDGNDKTWQATYTLQTGDPEGAISFTLDFQDLTGNTATKVTTVTSGNVVEFDETAPTLPTVTITSNNTNTTKAKVGDIITLNIEASEDIQTPTVTIAGKSATVTDNDDSNAKTWEATYQMEASDAEGLVAFTIDYKDLVNNSGTQVTSVTTGTDVTFDKTAPTASTVTIKSSNTDPTKAKVGDTITLDFTTSEDVQQPVVTIAGKTATVKTNGNSTSWIAEYTIKSNDPNGLIKFSIDFQDLSGNNGTQVTKTTDSSLVTVQVNNSNTGGSGGGGNNGNTRTVNVLIGEGNLSIAQVEITRETKENGKQVDVVNFNEEKANFVVNAALQQNQKLIRIMIDDLPNNPADEVSVTVPLKSINSLVKGNMSLEIMTNDVKITIPLETLIRLQQQGIDLYYNIKPIHNEKERTEVEDRTINADEVKKFAGNNAVIVHGKPMQIETNYKNHPTNVAFPLNGIKLPTDSKERKAFLDSLAVYIEHSDGEKKVQKGTIIYDSSGNPVEISFSVNKFSTFTIISVLDASTNHYFSDIQSDHWAKEMIQALVEKNIIKGYSDGTFRPNEPITRQHVAVILANTLAFEPQKEIVPFKDVPKNHMYYEAITLMQQAGIFEGSEGMFKPDTNITRAQMAIVLTNAFKLDSAKTTNTLKFKDVDQSHWAYNEITTLANIGISHGDNGYFKPNDSLTRAQFVAFLYRALNK